MKVFYQLTYPNVHNQYLEIIKNYPPNIKLYFPTTLKQKYLPLRISSKAQWVSFARYEGKEAVDLLHLVNTVGYRTKEPWITEFGDIGTFSRTKTEKVYTWRFRQAFKRTCRKKTCIKVLAKSKVAAIPLNTFNLINKEKIEIVYPAIEPQIKKNHTSSNEINLLFNIGSHPLFHWKGGPELLKAFKLLKNEYKKLTLTIIGEIPKDLKAPEDVFITGKIPRPMLINNYWPKADIMIHPTHMDSFGYVLLEAKAFGLPIVTTTQYAIPEIIKHEEQGFIIQDIKNTWYDSNVVGKKSYQSWLYPEISQEEFNRTVNDLYKYISLLIEDVNLRKKFGDSNYQDVISGKFSFEYRNKQILKIYKSATEC